MPLNCPIGIEPTCSPEPGAVVRSRLAGLQAELADLAYQLERQGRLDAADVTMTISARVSELLGGAQSTEMSS